MTGIYLDRTERAEMMSRLPLAHETDLPADIREILAKRESLRGFSGNSNLILAHRPDIFRAYTSLSHVVYWDGVLPLGLKALVAHVRSHAAGCVYCQAHTVSHADRDGVDGEKLETVWEFESSDLFTPAEKAALRLARDAALSPNAVTDDHFRDLLQYYSVGEVVELLAVVSLFGWLNTWNDSLATDLEALPTDTAARVFGPERWAHGAVQLGQATHSSDSAK